MYTLDSWWYLWILRPSPFSEVNLDGLGLFDQWEILECNGHGLLVSCVKVVLAYGEDVHWSRILGRWSNMIGYEMGPSPTGVYTMGQTSPVETLSMHEKMTWIPTWKYLLLGEFSRGHGSWATSNPPPKTWHVNNSNLSKFSYYFLHLDRHTNRCLK